jgi:hypothetical protein
VSLAEEKRAIPTTPPIENAGLPGFVTGILKGNAQSMNGEERWKYSSLEKVWPN